MDVGKKEEFGWVIGENIGDYKFSPYSYCIVFLHGLVMKTKDLKRHSIIFVGVPQTDKVPVPLS